MNGRVGRSPTSRDNCIRLILASAGVMAMAWVIAVFPKFSSEIGIVDIAKAVTVGETFKPEVLSVVDLQTRGGYAVRSSVLGKAAVIRLRLAEVAIRAGDPARIEQNLESLTKFVDEALLNAPCDPFLWLTQFWLDNARNGFRVRHLRDLRMSYDLGRYEGWIAA